MANRNLQQLRFCINKIKVTEDTTSVNMAAFVKKVLAIRRANFFVRKKKDD